MNFSSLLVGTLDLFGILFKVSPNILQVLVHLIEISKLKTNGLGG